MLNTECCLLSVDRRIVFGLLNIVFAVLSNVFGVLSIGFEVLSNVLVVLSSLEQ